MIKQQMLRCRHYRYSCPVKVHLFKTPCGKTWLVFWMAQDLSAANSYWTNLFPESYFKGSVAFFLFLFPLMEWNFLKNIKRGKRGWTCKRVCYGPMQKWPDVSSLLSWSWLEQNDPLDLDIPRLEDGQTNFKAMTTATFRAAEKCDGYCCFHSIPRPPS